MATIILWQDRELRFDCTIEELQVRPGEFEIDSINSVEDTKGNSGERGTLSITNLRIIWIQHRNPRNNLSIGFGCVVSLDIKEADSRIRGISKAMHLSAKFEKERYEYIFTSLVDKSPRLFTSIRAVYNTFNSTKVYRDLKLRSGIIVQKQLRSLVEEQITDTIYNVYNNTNINMDSSTPPTSSKGRNVDLIQASTNNYGTMYLTNIRVVWFSTSNDNFNVSIPYVQISRISVIDSQTGPVLSIDLSGAYSTYCFLFQIKPHNKLYEVNQELISLFTVYNRKPIFGIKFTIENQTDTLYKLNKDKIEDEDIITDTGGDAFAAYYALGGRGASDLDPVYNESLGLAIEPLPDSVDISVLWNVI